MPLRHRRSSPGVAPRPDARPCLKNRSPSAAAPPIAPVRRSVAGIWPHWPPPCLSLLSACRFPSTRFHHVGRPVFSISTALEHSLPNHQLPSAETPPH